MNRLLPQLLFFLQLHRMLRYIIRKRIHILMYHGFADRTAHDGIENHQAKYMPINLFRSQLAYLAKYHQVIPLQRLVDFYTKGDALPDNAVVITIDDGYRSAYTLAYPVLGEYQMPATLFIATDFVDNKQPLWTDRVEYAVSKATVERLELPTASGVLPLAFDTNTAKKVSNRRIRSAIKAMPQGERDAMVARLERDSQPVVPLSKGMPELHRPVTWQEVSDMRASGLISIGSHTHTHKILARCSAEESYRELALSKQIIEARIGGDCTFFCYPNGQAGDFDSRTREQLQALGYACGINSVSGLNDRNSDRFELLRFSPGKDLRTFQEKLSGVKTFFARMKRYFPFLARRLVSAG
ncbi:polysaccharide deacetylase family protein [Thermodesulfobacteriota bacterium]